MQGAGGDGEGHNLVCWHTMYLKKSGGGGGGGGESVCLSGKCVLSNKVCMSVGVCAPASLTEYLTIALTSFFFFDLACVQQAKHLLYALSASVMNVSAEI